MKNKRIGFSHWILSLIAVIVVSIIATVVVENSKAKAQMQAQLNTSNPYYDKQVVYGADGKKDGTALTTVPIQMFYEYIVYEDRVLYRYYYNSDKVQFTYELLNQFFDWIPEGINKHLMIVPSRILVEDPPEINDAKELKQAINEIYLNTSEDVNTIDITETMRSKKDEYIYFRTTKSWTALGGYYAAEDFLSSVGTQIVPIQEYNKYYLRAYLGTMIYLDGTDTLEENHDRIFYYMLPGASNTQNITVYVSSGEYDQYQSPTFATSRGGLSAFVGKYLSHTIIQGDGNNGQSIVVIGDSNARLFVSWLIPHYENICLINPLFYTGGGERMLNIISDYTITDILVLESVPMFSNSTENKRIANIAKTEKD